MGGYVAFSPYIYIGVKNVEKMTPPFFGSKIMNLLVFFDFEPKKCFRVPTP